MSTGSEPIKAVLGSRDHDELGVLRGRTRARVSVHDGAGLKLMIFESAGALQQLGFRSHRPSRGKDKLSEETL